MNTEVTSKGEYVPLQASAPPAEEDDTQALVEVFAVEVVPTHYVEVQAPADLPSNYELTVQPESGAAPIVVLVVRALIDY